MISTTTNPIDIDNTANEERIAISEKLSFRTQERHQRLEKKKREEVTKEPHKTLLLPIIFSNTLPKSTITDPKHDQDLKGSQLYKITLLINPLNTIGF